MKEFWFLRLLAMVNQQRLISCPGDSTAFVVIKIGGREESETEWDGRPRPSPLEQTGETPVPLSCRRPILIAYLGPP